MKSAGKNKGENGTGYPLVDAAIQAALHALHKTPIDALRNYPYPGSSQPHAATYLKNTMATKSVLSEQALKVRSVIQDMLKNEYSKIALKNQNNAAIAFKALARSYQKQTTQMPEAVIEANKLTSHPFLLMQQIASKFPDAVETAFRVAHDERQQYKLELKESKLGSQAAIKALNTKYPKLILPEEVLKLMRGIDTPTIRALRGYDPKALLAALKTYPPGKEKEAEFAAYKDAALRSPTNAAVALEKLARRWLKKGGT